MRVGYPGLKIVIKPAYLLKNASVDLFVDDHIKHLRTVVFFFGFLTDDFDNI